MNKDDKNRHFVLLIIGHRIVEMLYHSINNGGCGFLLLWFLFVRKFSGTKPGHHAVISFTKPGPAILT
jgi:hypothetical protein